MVKVLVADSNLVDNSEICQFLTNDKRFIVKTATSGAETLEMYWKIRPNVLIINSHFEDLSTRDILERMSAVKSERDKCNVILTMNKNEKSKLRDVTKVAYVFYKPFLYEDLIPAIEIISQKYNIPDLLCIDIESLLQPVEFNSYGMAYRYAQTAIEYCYYNPEELRRLENVLRHTAYVHNTTWTQVRDKINTALDPLRRANSIGEKGTLVDLFYFSDNITVKHFLDITVSHLRKKKGAGIF